MLIIIVSFGLIIVKEKGAELFSPKIEKKINEYIEEKYYDIKNDIKTEKLIYKKPKYIMKVTSNINNNHYFYIYYSNRTITDTYKEDYLEGKNILTNIASKLEKEINNKTNIGCKVNIESKLNNFTDKVKEKILNEDNLIELNIYNIEKELEVSSWSKEVILKEINSIISTYSKNNINPKNYTFIITDKNNITKSIEIYNLNNDFINNKYNLNIINDIINDNSNSKLLEQYKITYKILN